MMQHGLRLTARAITFGRVALETEGLGHIPISGPFVLAARHYHHLFDGATLYRGIARPLHLFVALDWAPDLMTRRTMELLCRLAGWPVGLRARPATAYRESERVVYLRRALRQCVTHLQNGSGLVFFPEGAPVIDPHGTRHEARSFAHGLCVAVELAQARLSAIPIVPVGLVYRRKERGYHVMLRCGLPLFHHDKRLRAATMHEVATRIEVLSRRSG